MQIPDRHRTLLAALVLSVWFAILPSCQGASTSMRVNILNPPGQFFHPRGTAIDSERRLYVADDEGGKGRIQRMDPHTETWTEIAGFNGKATGLAVDAYDNLYVADVANNSIQKRNAITRTWSTLPGGGLNGPFDVAVDAGGNVFVTDHYNNRVRKMNPAGTWTTFVAGGLTDGFVYMPQGIAVDLSGNVYVTDYYPSSTTTVARLQIFNSSGGFVTRMGSSSPSEGSLDRPYGISVSASNQIYVADMYADNVMKNFGGPSAWAPVVVTNSLDAPEHVCLDARGYLYISDTGNHMMLRVEMATATTYIASLNIASPSLSAAGYSFTWPGADGWFYVVQYSDVLTDPVAWMDLPGNWPLTGTNAAMTFNDPDATNVSKRFYRIVAH